MDPLSSPYFLGAVTTALGGGRYAFQEMWIDPTGAVVARPNGRYGDETAPGYAIDGSEFAAGSLVYCRWADGAGGFAWELSSVSPASASGSGVSCPPNAPKVQQDTQCIGGTLYKVSGQLFDNEWCNVRAVPVGCCECPPSGSGSGNDTQNPCGDSAAEPVMATFPQVGCATTTFSGALTYQGNDVWEGPITDGSGTGTFQLKRLGDGSFVWSALLAGGEVVSGSLTDAGGCLLTGTTICGGYGVCAFRCPDATGTIVVGNPCCNSSGSGSGSGGSGSGGSGSGGSGSGSIVSACCTLGQLPSTLYLNFSGASTNITCLDGLRVPMTYQGTDAVGWNNEGAGAYPCTPSGGPQQANARCSDGYWIVTYGSPGGCAGTTGVGVIPAGDCTGNVVISGVMTFGSVTPGTCGTGDGSGTVNFTVTRT